MKFIKAKAKHLRLGKKGENIACRFLQTKNYNILFRNYKSSYGEIDIIARNGTILCFIEVKTRSFSKNSRDERSTRITLKQAKRIKKSASDYLYKLESPKLYCRFELIEITTSPLRIISIHHWLDNFGMKITPGGLTAKNAK